jgi:ABC-2 type transport system ATP-binding protein
VPWERQDGYRRQFALLLGQKNQLWWDLPARESLELNARIYGIPQADFQRQLIAALLHRPKVLFLDEPTIGLDVVSQQTVREFLREYNETFKTTILLTSHYMADIRALCRRVIIIDHGKIFFDGELSEVIDRFADFKVITIQTGGSGDSSKIDLSRYGEVIERNPQHFKLKVKRDRVIAVCKELLDDLPVNDIDIQEVPIEDVIRQIFAR